MCLSVLPPTHPCPQVALVGYTNAGKSSLMAALAKGSGVVAEDRLFATLDPTLRCAVHAGVGAAPGTRQRSVLFSHA